MEKPYLLRQTQRLGVWSGQLWNTRHNLALDPYSIWQRSQAGGIQAYKLLKAMHPGKQLVVSTITGTALILSSVAPAMAGTITVNKTADNTTVDNRCTLREAIAVANSNTGTADCPIVGVPGNDIIAMTGISGTITLGSNLPDITENVQLNGAVTGTVTIDGGGNQAIYGNGASVGVDRLTITNVSGDGIYASNSITVTNNSVISGATHGIYAYNGSVSVDNSTVTGAARHGVNTWYGDVLVSNGSVIRGAIAGVHAYGVPGSTGNITITNSIITGTGSYGVRSYYGNVMVANNSVISGGTYGVNAYNGFASVADSIVTGTVGDGVFADKNAVITDSIITGGDYGVFANGGDATVNNSAVTGVIRDGINAFSNATFIFWL